MSEKMTVEMTHKKVTKGTQVFEAASQKDAEIITVLYIGKVGMSGTAPTRIRVTIESLD